MFGLMVVAEVDLAQVPHRPVPARIHPAGRMPLAIRVRGMKRTILPVASEPAVRVLMVLRRMLRVVFVVEAIKAVAVVILVRALKSSQSARERRIARGMRLKAHVWTP